MANKYDGVIVTVADMRQVAYCSRGAREFATRHNLDFRKFLDEGLPASEFIALDDAQCLLAVEAAAKRMGIE
jgi:hypothetical protein